MCLWWKIKRYVYNSKKKNSKYVSGKLSRQLRFERKKKTQEFLSLAEFCTMWIISSNFSHKTSKKKTAFLERYFPRYRGRNWKLSSILHCYNYLQYKVSTVSDVDGNFFICSNRDHLFRFFSVLWNLL